MIVAYVRLLLLRMRRLRWAAGLVALALCFPLLFVVVSEVAHVFGDEPALLEQLRKTPDQVRMVFVVTAQLWYGALFLLAGISVSLDRESRLRLLRVSGFAGAGPWLAYGLVIDGIASVFALGAGLLFIAVAACFGAAQPTALSVLSAWLAFFTVAPLALLGGLLVTKKTSPLVFLFGVVAAVLVALVRDLPLSTEALIAPVAQATGLLLLCALGRRVLVRP